MINQKSLLIMMGIALVFNIFGFSLTTAAISTQETKIQIKGWLLDKCCINAKEPAKHSKHCLLMASCAASGYGIVEKQANGNYEFYLFDPKGQELAKEFLAKTTKDNNFLITVQGSWDGSVLKVETIRD